MNITDERVTAYLQGLYRPLNPFLSRLRAEAEEEEIPIILRDTETLVRSLLAIRRPERILEIGTAVGYSALCFAAAAPQAEILTCEIRPELVRRAEANIKKAEEQGNLFCENGKFLNRRIRVVCGDAAETLRQAHVSGNATFCGSQSTGGSKEISENEENPIFDFIFLDGAHGHYRAMWQAFRPFCASGTVVLADNVLFKGMTASEDFLDCHRNRTIMNRMRGYLTYVTELSDAETSVLSVGDGVALSVIR